MSPFDPSNYSNVSVNCTHTFVWGAIFQQDNARLHLARVSRGILRHVQTLPWPTHSLYLFPIDHSWDQLKRQMLLCHSVLEVSCLRIVGPSTSKQHLKPNQRNTGPYCSTYCRKR
ncbi:DDE_3 domain-containing protein [Trichonephila clavipes]|nr:DDE_3 domain-containing protein [Trichonephila clavipes]